MLRTCATWQSLTTKTTTTEAAESKLLQALAEAATRCTPLLLQLLRRNAEDVVVVVVVVVVCWMQHLSAVFVVWIVSKTCAAAHPPLWQGAVSLPLRCPLHILCMFNELPQNLLPQIDAGCQLQVATVTGTGKRRWKVKMRVTVTGSWSCLSLSLCVHLPFCISLYLSLSLSISPHCVLNKFSFLSSSHYSYALFNPAATQVPHDARNEAAIAAALTGGMHDLSSAGTKLSG